MNINPFRKPQPQPTPAQRLTGYLDREVEAEIARYREYVRRMETIERTAMEREAEANDATWAGRR